ncbi:MAG TPA: cysteine desulfurase family protein [Deltaproteobacteria bacterium]|jgi:cysteine desulfurase|nr:cysteine desulfurase family protein [Deltaproteobacteria bacterium]HOI07534.1 cysteine desulfurase family protein [Deltaproteobacteria bacterium]
MSHGHELFLDHASTTPLHPDALGVMLPCFGNHFGIPGTASRLGLKALDALEEARARVAGLINAHPQEIVFTGSGTESNNLAILGSVRAQGSKGRHIITSRVEHASVLNVCRHLEREGFRVTYVPVDANGRVDTAAVEDAVEDDTILISIMHANHAVGTLQPVAEIGAMAHGRGITFHVDAVQSAGRVPLNVEDLPVDLMSISSHKLYGPKGVGALYLRSGTELSPVTFGLDQEHGIRPGTENIPGIVGFGMACAVAVRDLDRNSMLVSSLRDSLEGQVLNAIAGAVVNASAAPRLPHITSLSIDGIAGNALTAYLDVMDITAFSSPPLGRQGEDLSYVLEAMDAHGRCSCGALRLSLGWENKEREVKRAVDSLTAAVSKLRDFDSAASGRELGFFTFADRESVARSLEGLEGAGIPVVLMPRPDGVAHGASAPVALCSLASDQEAIGSILGRLGIEPKGVHRVKTRYRAMERKEQAFWQKVENVRKGMN